MEDEHAKMYVRAENAIYKDFTVKITGKLVKNDVIFKNARISDTDYLFLEIKDNKCGWGLESRFKDEEQDAILDNEKDRDDWGFDENSKKESADYKT